jgi:hypothetical protein
VNKIMVKQHKSRLFPQILIVMLLVSTPLLLNQVFSKPNLIINVELTLRWAEISTGRIDGLNIGLSPSPIETADNITLRSNLPQSTANISYLLVFTLNESPSPSHTWNYTIADRSETSGWYNGYVITSVELKGSHRLTIDLILRDSGSELTCGTKTLNVQIF